MTSNTIRPAQPQRTWKRQDPAWAKRWRYDRDHGIRRYADAGPVRAHIETLRAQHASDRGIAEAAGVSTHVIYAVTSGQSLIRSVNADRILAVELEDLFDRKHQDGMVPSVGTVRRMQALAALGHSAQTVADVMGAGATPTIVRNLRGTRGGWVSRRNHDRARAAYEALWDQPGTSHQTRAAAQRAGYAPPLAWDDDTIEDPNAQPQHQVGATAVSSIKRVHLDDIHELATDGHTLGQIAHRLGVSKDAIGACLRRTHDTARAREIRRRLHHVGTATAEIPA